jgi:hypothetical protein
VEEIIDHFAIVLQIVHCQINVTFLDFVRRVRGQSFPGGAHSKDGQIFMEGCNMNLTAIVMNLPEFSSCPNFLGFLDG